MNEQPGALQLRRRAEKMLAGKPQKTMVVPVDKLAYELQLCQIQLEIQNENLRQVQFELERCRERYMDFYDFAPVAYLTLTESGLISEINLNGVTLLGVERDRLLYHRLTPYVATDDQDRWLRHFATVIVSDAALACELALQKHDGSRFNAHLECLRQLKLDDVLEVRIVLTDITERIKNEEEIRRLAFYDSLTQLPNRRLLDDRLDHAMAAGRRSGRYGALMFIDLDNFKPLNDLHGHYMGDLLLIEVSRRITRCLRETDTVARFGGDEFVVLLGELDTDLSASVSQAALVAEKIRTTLSESYRLNTHGHVVLEHHCTSSIGVVMFNNHDHSKEHLLKWSDMAMYEAKESGSNKVNFFEPARMSQP